MSRFLPALLLPALVSVSIVSAAPSLREFYLTEARKELVARTGGNPAVWTWLDAHPDVRTGLLIADSQPNPDHLLNLQDLLAAVTPPQRGRFANLLLVVSDVRGLLLRYRVAVSGLGPVRQELDPTFSQALADAKQRSKRLGVLLPDLQAAATAAPAPEKIVWLESLRTRMPAPVRYAKNAKGLTTDTTYAWVCAELAKTLKTGNAAAKTKAKLLDEELGKEKDAADA